MQGLPFLFACGNGDDAVIAELVHQLAAAAEPGRVLGHGADVILAAAQSGQVELVGFVGQLSDALDVQRLKIFDGSRHLQAVQVLAVIAERRLCLGALGVLVVQFGLFQVLFREGSDLKVAAVIQHLDVVLGTVQRRHGHAGHLGGHDGTFGGVVIGKDKAVRAQVQFGGDVGQVAVLRLPVGLDRDKIVRPQHAVRVVQTRQRVGFVIFGVHGQDHADGFQRLAVALELGVDLALRHLGTDGQPVDAVVAHDAAPERIVQVQHKGFFVTAVQRLDDIGHTVGQRRDGIQTHGIFVHVPEEGVAPGGQAVIGGEVVNIVDVKMLVRGGVGIELLVHPADEVGAAVGVPDVAVAHQAEVGAVKVVLDDRAAELGLQCLPHRLKMSVLVGQHRVDIGVAVGGGGQGGQVAPAGVDVDDVGVELVQLRRAEHGVLPILGVLALVELGLDAVLQQKQPQLVGHFVRGGPAEDGDFFAQGVRVLGQQLPPQPPLFAQQRFSIQRIVETIHGWLLFNLTLPRRLSGPG